jgi:hypothetical protein
VLDRHLRPRGHGAGAVALLVAVAVAGCGGGDGDSESSPAATTSDATLPATTKGGQTAAAFGSQRTDQLLITESIEGVFASGDPSKACEDDVTPAYVQKAFGDLDGCRAAQVPGSVAGSVDVSAVSVAGDKATADAVPHGGPSNGETVHVALVYEDAAWKVDSTKSDVPVGP